MGTISVNSLGKAYKKYPSRWERLLEWIVPFSPKRHCYHWVLQDINFHIKPGEAVGIIGINGAGKSTLLKMITGTTQPTTGSVAIEGRVAALLELGMGFHQDFTGRQNAYMAGQLIGLTVDEITELMPEIESFAEIGDYIDQPVRVYSSGMQMRLAFSVATAKRPDVLIVDEALSVGDAYFQHKSFDRIHEFRNAGTTLLIVSHDKQAIQNLCDRAILLNNGHLAIEGEPEEIMDLYNALLFDRAGSTVKQERTSTGTITSSGTGKAVCERLGLYDQQGNQIEVVMVGQSVELQVDINVHEPIKSMVLGWGIKDRLGQVIYGTNTQHARQMILNPSEGSVYRFTISFEAALGPGEYSIQVSAVDHDSAGFERYVWIDRALMFTVVNIDKQYFIGTTWLNSSIQITKVGG